jgi:hypothetical protein
VVAPTGVSARVGDNNSALGDPGPVDHDLNPGEIEILIDGLTDDVSLDWALIHLGIMGNP